MVGLAGSSADQLSSRLGSDGHFAVTMIGNTTNILNNVPVRLEFPYKLQVFVIIAQSSTVLDTILKYIKKSLWWNHMATFLILGDPESKDECSKAHDMLWTAWETDMPNGKFVCLDQSNQTLIYSYNPYSTYAPNPWKFANSYPGKNNHPWSLFVGNYWELVPKNCHELEFETTDDLNGYEIPYMASDSVKIWHTKPNKTGIDSFGGSQGERAKILYRALNATAKRVQLSKNPLMNRYMKEVDRDRLIELTIGLCDVSLNPFYREGILNMSMLYPRWQSGLSVMAQHKGNVPQLIKISRVIDTFCWIGVSVVILITLIFFIFCLRQPLIIALLNILRLVCNSVLPVIPKKVAFRIYLACVFIFVVNIQGMLQGKLASVLTKDVHRPNVETVKQLADSDYTIHVYKQWFGFFDDPAFEGRLREKVKASCVDYVLNDSSTACMLEESILVYEAAQFNLHMSSNYIYKQYYTYAIRENWPLEQSVNEILSSLAESSIADYKWKNELEKPRRILNNRRKAGTEDHQVLILQELRFSFAILGSGLGCATVLFIIELAINRFGKRIRERFSL